MFVAIELASGTSRSHGNQVAPSVVIETFNVPDPGDGVPPEVSQVRRQFDWIGTFIFYIHVGCVLSHCANFSMLLFSSGQIVSAVLGSFGFSNIGGVSNGIDVRVSHNFNYQKLLTFEYLLERSCFCYYWSYSPNL